MNSISTDLQTHYAGTSVTLARCLRLERVDGTVLGFTSLDHDLTFGGTLYAAVRGIMGSDVSSGSALDVDNTETSGMLNSDNITDADLNAGLWDYCAFRLFELNYRDLTMGSRKVRAGNLGQVSSDRAGFTAELVGLLQRYQTIIVELSSVGCRASLGDARCKINLSGYTITGAITSGGSGLVLADSGRGEADDYFAYGVISMTSGANDGISREVKSFANTGGVINLQLPFPYAVAVADTYSMHAGCDKAKRTCIDKFDNVVNMRAEPDLQGRDRLVQVGR